MRPRQNVTVRLDSHAPWILLERSGGSVSVTHDNVMTHHATAACPPVRTLQIIERRLVVLSARLQPPPGLHQRSRRTVPFHRRSSGQFPSSPRQQKTSSFNLTGTGSAFVYNLSCQAERGELLSLQSSRILLVYYEAVWELGRLSRGSSSSSATELSQMSPLK